MKLDIAQLHEYQAFRSLGDHAKVPPGYQLVDANLMHDVVTGRSCSGILEFLNQTPIDWFSKRQNQVETATYRSEFMVARQGVERLIDLRCVPVDGAWMFGDNKTVVTSSTIPHSTLGKRWNALSYHRVREAIASGWLRFEHIPGRGGSSVTWSFCELRTIIIRRTNLSER